MPVSPTIYSKNIKPARKHERKVILRIALFWTAADLLFFLWRQAVGILPEKYYKADTLISCFAIKTTV